MTSRVFSDTGMWNHEALIAGRTVRNDIEAIYDKLADQGYNFREAFILINEEVQEEALWRALNARGSK